MKLIKLLFVALIAGNGVHHYIQAATQTQITQAKTTFETKLAQYETAFNSFSEYPENPTKAEYDAYQTQLKPLQDLLNAFLLAAKTYADMIRVTNPSQANLLDAQMKYEPLFFQLVTTPQSDALNQSLDQAAAGYIFLLIGQNLLQDARDVAEEIYGDLAKLYYYPNLYTDQKVAQNVAIANYGDIAYAYYFPQLFTSSTDRIKGQNAALAKYGNPAYLMFYPNLFTDKTKARDAAIKEYGLDYAKANYPNLF
jgi:hypothetical protein